VPANGVVLLKIPRDQFPGLGPSGRCHPYYHGRPAYLNDRRQRYLPATSL